MPSKNKAGCACCNGCDCCSDSPAYVFCTRSVDVTIPAGEFANIDANCNCVLLNGNTYTLSADDCSIGGISFPGSCRCLAGASNSVGCFGEICAWLEKDGTECRMVVAILKEGNTLKRDVFIYKSALEAAPFTCALKTWTCNYDSTPVNQGVCTSAQTSLTVEANAA